ncbi:hypothetical protein [Clostridium fallax]|uniref:Uncharacterized protein n=1 Tax=Clostridium fallax TaxID=1533 RepID=A0A1M4U2Z6_9CLOT|nr:hypothetical protein [Clostridium fallax]SHE51014.1 hypothetical protein SAMN05443638_1046 [Clostridium fallax]SQB06049.1 Uncharacterised protein [Clostridium fallax]
MKDIFRESYLKDAPEYEDYSENVAVLNKEELKELGFTFCGSKGKCGSCSGGCCNKENDKCKSKCCSKK